jgi:hypothetical protein
MNRLRVNRLIALPCIIAASLVIAGVKQMANFVYYLRNTDGCIKRLSNVIAIGPTGLLGGYKHEEQITGFPEPTVFWASNEGSTVGVAPLGFILPRSSGGSQAYRPIRWHATLHATAKIAGN